MYFTKKQLSHVFVKHRKRSVENEAFYVVMGVKEDKNRETPAQDRDNAINHHITKAPVIKKELPKPSCDRGFFNQPNLNPNPLYYYDTPKPEKFILKSIYFHLFI